MYNTSMTLADCREICVKDLEWLYGRLLQQKRDEKEANKESQKKEMTWHKKFH